MIEQDTVKLLRECDAGVKMGVASIGEVLDEVRAAPLRRCLAACKDAHERLEREIRAQLDACQDEGKAPDPVAKGMSWLKTNWKLAVDGSDATVADLMTDGCHMGVKALHRYLNQYRAADERAKDVARRLADLEEQLVADLRPYL